MSQNEVGGEQTKKYVIETNCLNRELTRQYLGKGDSVQRCHVAWEALLDVPGAPRCRKS